jgi:hypothetical protein
MLTLTLMLMLMLMLALTLALTLTLMLMAVQMAAHLKPCPFQWCGPRVSSPAVRAVTVGPTPKASWI